MALTKITKTGIGADAIDGNKLGDNSISDEHLDITAITGQTELAEVANDSDVILIYDASAGALKKVLKSNFTLQVPSLSSVSPTNVLTGDGTGNATFTITGTGFDGTATAVLVTDGGSEVSFDTVTRDSSTQITAVIAVSSLSNANEPYDVKVANGSGLTNTLTNQINIDAQPVFNTASGSVGSFSEQTTISTIDIEAYDPDSAGNVTLEIQSGSLPAGLSATTVNENGVSKYRITGTLSTDVASSTTTNFTLRAVDAASNTSSRAFSITEIPSGVESFTSSGTFSVPTGITSVDVLVVGGGGGGGSDNGGGAGAGGLIFVPGFSVTPGGTVSVTVGCGGAGQPTGNPGINGQDSVFGTLTAKGGGYGGGCNGGPLVPGNPGGSGGAANGHSPGVPGAAAIQPTQPGQSGAYGFGNPGGTTSPAVRRAGGGGGAASAGGNGTPSISGAGGAGKSYTIADGTTPVAYAGGGGGAPNVCGAAGAGSPCGTGGAGKDPGSPSAGSGIPGTANRGGGGGAGMNAPGVGGSGGKGIVIVRY